MRKPNADGVTRSRAVAAVFEPEDLADTGEVHYAVLMEERAFPANVIKFREVNSLLLRLNR